MTGQGVDWGQAARLMTISTASMDPDGGTRMSGPTVASGSLAEMATAYRQLPKHLVARARIVIAGGFHLDGVEIDDFLASHPGS